MASYNVLIVAAMIAYCNPTEIVHSSRQMCRILYAGIGRIDHTCPHKKKFGENLAYTMDSSGAPSKEAATKQGIEDWYGEVKVYKYDSPADKSNGETRHFTQLVWKSSTSFGIGFSTKSTYNCALYDPMGNDMSDNYNLYKENVLEP